MAVLAPDLISKELKQLAEAFLTAMRDGDYERVWHYLITLEAAHLLSTAMWPLYAYETNEVEKLFDPIRPQAPQSESGRGEAQGRWSLPRTGSHVRRRGRQYHQPLEPP